MSLLDQFMDKKHSEGSSYKVYMMASANKFLRICYAFITVKVVSTEQIPIFAAAIKSAKSAQTGAKGYAGFYADSTLQSTWQA